MDRICAYTGWPVGHVYLAGADSLRWVPTSIWHLHTPERFAAFQEATQTVEYAAGDGMIGRVGALGKPEWNVEVTTDPAVHRQRAALAAGLAAGVAAVPLAVGMMLASASGAWGAVSPQCERIQKLQAETVGKIIKLGVPQNEVDKFALNTLKNALKVLGDKAKKAGC